MSVVDEPVEDGLGVGWVTDGLVAFVDRHLAGEDGRAAAVAFFEDLVEIAACTAVERFEAPIVEDQELSAVEASHDAGMAPVAAGQCEIGEELGDALIEDRAVVAASLVAESTSKPTFPDAGWPAQDQIVVRVHAFAGSKLLQPAALHAARAT